MFAKSILLALLAGVGPVDQMPGSTASADDTVRLRVTARPFCRSTGAGETWSIRIVKKAQAVDLSFTPRPGVKDPKALVQVRELGGWGDLGNEAVTIGLRVAGDFNGSRRVYWTLQWITPDGRTFTHEELTTTEATTKIILIRMPEKSKGP